MTRWERKYIAREGWRTAREINRRRDSHRRWWLFGIARMLVSAEVPKTYRTEDLREIPLRGWTYGAKIRVKNGPIWVEYHYE